MMLRTKITSRQSGQIHTKVWNKQFPEFRHLVEAEGVAAGSSVGAMLWIVVYCRGNGVAACSSVGVML